MATTALIFLALGSVSVAAFFLVALRRFGGPRDPDEQEADDQAQRAALEEFARARRRNREKRTRDESLRQD